MTSISQPVIPNPGPTNASSSSHPSAPTHSSSVSSAGRGPSQTAGNAAARSSYANATKKTFSPPPATSGSSTPLAAPAQHGKLDTTASANGKVAIPPAVPAVGTPTIVNGSTPTSSTSGPSDLARKPSVTISASGPPQYAQNGASITGKPPGGSSIQFGSYNADGSPRPTNATPHQTSQSTSSLGVHHPSNPRITSPANSPSPIPQPPASGGKPPSHGHNLSVSFGSSSGPDPSMRPAIPPGPLAPGAQHLRRESSQSQHSDMSNHGMGPGSARGGYPPQGGRGRGYGPPPYQQQMAYSPQPGHRQLPPNQTGNRNITPYSQGQQPNRPYSGFPNSPHQVVRSPVPHHSQPTHPQHQQGQMPMPNPQMGGPYGYASQYGGYGPNVPPPQAYGMANSYMADPAYQSQFQMYYGGFSAPMQPVPSQSPRPANQMPPHGAPAPFQAPYAPQGPTPMSRTPSAVSGIERPNSGMGATQTSGPAPALAGGAPSAPGNASNANSAPKPSGGSFQIPTKKSAGIVIRNPNSGDIVDLKKHSASPAPSNKSPATTSATPTPPPRAPSHDPQHSRAESKSAKTNEEKRAEMKDAIARKVEADKAEEQRKKEEARAAQEQKEKEAQEAQQLKEREEAEAKQREAEEAAKLAAQKAADEQEKLRAEQIPKVVEPVQEAESEEAKKAREAQELEDEIARWEAEAAEQERKEAEAEKAYSAKKQAERDEAARKEAESFKMDEEAMRKAEREAEEAEEARAKEQQGGAGSEKEREDVHEELKKSQTGTPSNETPAAQETPQGSGIATPVSETSSVPTKATPATGKQKPAALNLTLETKKAVEPPQPTPQLLSLRSARKLTHINDVSYPAAINSPNPALNTAAPMGKFKYDRDFLLQFQKAFTEKPSENWTERVKETLGETTEPSSARATPARSSAGGSANLGGRQPSQRGPIGVMGSFQNQRTLPPGTTSQSRFEASTRGGTQPARPTMQNPLASFVSRPGAAFPQPSATIKMDRTPSSTGMAHPNSPRNASQRGGSQRGSRASGRREDPKDNKTMPLTAGAQIKPIEITSSGWKPTSVGANSMAGPAPGGDGLMTPDVVQRKVKANLNKMTPNNFDKLSGQILEIAHQSKDETDGRSLRQVIQLTFEKATDEAHWAEMYAQFCHRMLESMSPEIKDESIRDKTGKVVAGGHLFRKYLLTRCQTEFERGWKVNLPDKPEGETEEAVMLSDAYYTAAAAKRRGLGLVRFIGELYKLGMLTERIMHECVKKLVDYEATPDEAEVESLTSLLKTIGHQLDNSEKGHQMMDVYFGRISQMVALPDLPSRLRFMLMDIVDLRKANWQGKGGVLKGPTTLDEVRHQVAEAERQKEAQRIAESSRRGGGGGGRPPIGRGDARAFSGGGGQSFGMPPPEYAKTVGMDDLRRLGSKTGSRQVSSQGTTFGPTSMFNSARGSNTRKPLSIARGDDSGASSRVSTPPMQKEKKEQEAKKSVNTFSALAGLESAESADANASPASSPPNTKSQPATDRARSKSPLGKDTSPTESSKKDSSETS